MNFDNFGGRKFLGVCVWTLFWGIVTMKGTFATLCPEAWTFLTACLTPLTAGIWGAYLGINVWQKKISK